MLRNYYYLVSGLPDLMMDLEQRDFSVEALKEEVRDLVHPSDYRLVELLHAPSDNDNFLNKLLERGLQPSDTGNISPAIFDDLEENISELPAYMQDFYYSYTGKKRTDESDLEDDSQENDGTVTEKLPEVRFLESFYRIALNNRNRFIREWFGFVRDFNNILAALSCRKLNLDPTYHLVGDYPLVEILTHSQASDFGLKQEIDYIDKLMQAVELDDVMDRERKLDMIRWNMADELTTWDYFNINFVLAFFVKAGIINRWLKLDAKVGEELFKRLFDDLKATYNLAESFSS